MLKISEMAKLANTTRRTLIFYDQTDIFKPAEKNDAGYRYYEYEQLYDLMFILGLRSLDIPLDEIKAIKSQTNQRDSPQLITARKKIDKKINELVEIQKVIDNKLSEQTNVDELALYHPKIEEQIQMKFWCSKQSVNCTEEEVALLFSNFYKQLDSLAITNTTKSGFLTELSIDNPTGYADASFRVIKEVTDTEQNIYIPIMEKVTGNYASILVENTLEGIVQGLTKLKDFCQENNLKTEDHLWQINIGEILVKTGSSKYGWLGFAII